MKLRYCPLRHWFRTGDQYTGLFLPIARLNRSRRQGRGDGACSILPSNSLSSPLDPTGLEFLSPRKKCSIPGQPALRAAPFGKGKCEVSLHDGEFHDLAVS